MDLQPFPPAQTHAASCSICSVDFKMYTNVGQVLVRFHQSFVQLNAGVPRRRGGDHHAPDGGDRLSQSSVRLHSLQQRMHRFLRFRINRCFARSQTAGPAALNRQPWPTRLVACLKLDVQPGDIADDSVAAGSSGWRSRTCRKDGRSGG